MLSCLKYILLLVLSVNSKELFPDGRIIGGKKANIINFPYQVSVKRYSTHICGGSIITESYILTAAHCVYKQNAKSYTVGYGSTNYRNPIAINQVSALYVHPMYNETTMEHDIAIIKLKDPLQFTKNVLPIALPRDGEKINAGTKALITGWGYTQEEGSVSTLLQVIEVPIVTKEVCQNAYLQEYISDNVICAGFVGKGGKDACQGDSGGPMRAAGKLMGIVSWGYGCARPQYPGVYTKVSRYRLWIKSITNY